MSVFRKKAFCVGSYLQRRDYGVPLLLFSFCLFCYSWNILCMFSCSGNVVCDVCFPWNAILLGTLNLQSMLLSFQAQHPVLFLVQFFYIVLTSIRHKIYLTYFLFIPYTCSMLTLILFWSPFFTVISSVCNIVSEVSV